MSVGEVLSGHDYFDEEFGVSVSKLLGMLRRSFAMDMAFIGKFENGSRTMVFVESDNNISARSQSFCFSHPESQTYCRKIADGELPSIIPDTQSNEITRLMKVTDELSIGAYLGVPIYLSDGEIYGTLCCIKYSSDPSLETRDPSLLTFVADVIADRVEFHRNIQEHDNQIRDRIERLSLSNELTMHFQPIWSVTDSAICGYEALARFNTEPYRSPDVWFKEAGQVGLGDFLESLAITRALSQLPKIPEFCFLSINASPDAILSGAVGELLNRQDAHRVILEVTTKAEFDVLKELKIDKVQGYFIGKPAELA